MRNLGRIWRFLRSTRTATWLLLGLALAAALGSFLPQVPRDVAAHGAWQRAMRGRYAGLADLLWALELTRFYGSLWFWLPALCLLVSLAVCTIGRWRSVLRSATLYSHLLPLLVVFGGLLSVRCAERHRLLVAAGDAAQAVQLRRWGCGLPGRIAAAPRAPATGRPAVSRVAVTDWRVDRNAAGHPIGSRAQVTIQLPEGTTCSGEARPSHPLRCRDYAVVLLGAGSWSMDTDALGTARVARAGIDALDAAQVAWPGIDALDAARVARASTHPPDVAPVPVTGPGISPVTSAAYKERTAVELLLVRDPGYRLVVAGLAGLVVTSAASLVRPRRWRCRRAGQGSNP